MNNGAAIDQATATTSALASATASLRGLSSRRWSASRRRRSDPLMATGMPCSGPRSLPAASSASARRAVPARARSASRRRRRPEIGRIESVRRCGLQRGRGSARLNVRRAVAQLRRPASAMLEKIGRGIASEPVCGRPGSEGCLHSGKLGDAVAQGQITVQNARRSSTSPQASIDAAARLSAAAKAVAAPADAASTCCAAAWPVHLRHQAGQPPLTRCRSGGRRNDRPSPVQSPISSRRSRR